MHGALRMCAAMTFSSDSSASFLSRCSRTVAADRGGGGGGGVDDMAADVVCALNSAPNLRTVSTFQISDIHRIRYPLYCIIHTTVEKNRFVYVESVGNLSGETFPESKLSCR